MNQPVESYEWHGPGYQPLVFFDGWQVAVLNWEAALNPARISEIERHVETDEVFILGQGHAALYTEIDHEIHMQDLKMSVIYNVPKGLWHNLVVSNDAILWIVENKDTHLHDTELRALTSFELDHVHRILPDWAA